MPTTQHLKLHSLTGNTDHDVTGLASGQLVYIQNSEAGVQSTGLHTNGTGALTASTISVTTLSGGTILSGSTNLYDIFQIAGTDPALVAGSNIQLGEMDGAIALVSSPSIDNLSFSGTATGGNISATSGTFTTLSGGTILSGSTNLYSLFTQGSGTVGTLPLWNGTKTIGDSLISQSGTGVTVNASIQIYGNVDILGTATTFNTTIVQTTDNNITMNLSGSHVSALNGGITVLSGKVDNSSSTWAVDADGAWSANTRVYANGITVGGTIVSGSTDLYSIFSLPTTSADLISASTGTNSIIANNGTGNLASGQNAVALGNNSRATGANSFAVGLDNQATAAKSGVFGGHGNQATSDYAVIVGSRDSIASGHKSGVFAGSNSTASGTASAAVGGSLHGTSGNYSFAGGGRANTVSGVKAATIGGQYHTAGGLYSAIAGGSQNTVTADGIRAFIGGGLLNRAENDYTSVIGGKGNTASADHSSVIGGSGNTASGVHAVVIGGSGNTASGRNTIVVGGRNIAGSADDSIYADNARLAHTAGSIIYSAGTDLYSIFVSTADGNDITRVQPGSNITTGGTENNPTVNLAASPSVNGFTASGATSLQSVSGTTIHADNFFDIVPYTGANPTSTANNNVWFYSASTGIITLNYKVGGSVKSVELS